MTPGVSRVLIQYLFSAKPVGAVIICVLFHRESSPKEWKLALVLPVG